MKYRVFKNSIENLKRMSNLIMLLSTFNFLLSTLVVKAQTPPNAFNYSAVARNAAGQPIATATIGIQISILKTSATGVSQYSENHFVNTDAFGLFNLIIGTGAMQSGTMANIDWSNDNYYLKVGMDATGGTNFLTMGTTQLLSVPYAMYAKSAGSITNGSSQLFSLEYPEGVTGNFINTCLKSSIQYTVPSGLNLYITSMQCYPKVNNVIYGTDGSGLIFPSATTLSLDTSVWQGSGATECCFTGLLVPATNLITPVHFQLNEFGATYTVPTGKKLVLKSGTGQGSPLCINGNIYNNSTGIWLFPSGVTISNCNASTYTSRGFGYTGYLLDN